MNHKEPENPVMYLSNLIRKLDVKKRNGVIALGETKQDLTCGAPSDGHYIYLTTGATHTAASVYTAGKLIIKLYGYATF